MSDYYEHLEAAWNDLSKEDKEKFISSNIRQQQPIPQDINKAGEWLHDFFTEYSETLGMGQSVMSMEKWREAANGVAQLLLPELQQLRETVESFNRTVRKQDDCIIKQAAEIESLKRDAEDFKNGYIQQNEERNYWKQRCEAAEENIAAYSDWHGAVMENGNSAMPVEFERWEKAFKHWQTLKQQTHGDNASKL